MTTNKQGWIRKFIDNTRLKTRKHKMLYLALLGSALIVQWIVAIQALFTNEDLAIEGTPVHNFLYFSHLGGLVGLGLLGYVAAKTKNGSKPL